MTLRLALLCALALAALYAAVYGRAGCAVVTGRNASSGAQTATVNSISYRDLSP